MFSPAESHFKLHKAKNERIPLLLILFVSLQTVNGLNLVVVAHMSRTHIVLNADVVSVALLTPRLQ